MTIKIKKFYDIYEFLETVDTYQIYVIICRNARNFRIKHYEKYKKEYNGARGIDNPYSAGNVADYLGISETYYRRLENEHDKDKHMSIDKLVKLAYLYDKRIDDFLKN